MSAYRSSVKCRLSYVAVALFIIVIIAFLTISAQFKKHVGEICEYKGSEVATKIMTDSVEKQLCYFEDCRFFTVIRDDEGNILSAEINSAEVNLMKNELVKEINKRLSTVDKEKVSVPVGTLTDITYLSGRGFDIGIKFHSMGNVKSEIKSSFESAGINQTKFSLYIIITADIKAVMPFETKAVSVAQEFLVSETIIVGEVPQTYLSTD